MKKYVVLYCAPLAVAERFAQATPEEAMQGMGLWTAWAERIGDGLIDPGGPLANPMSVTPAGIAKSDSSVIGMSLLQAATMEAALDMVADHHHLQWADDCEIIVLEEVAIPELSTEGHPA